MSEEESKKKTLVYMILVIFIGICVYQLHNVIDDFINGDKWTNTIKPVHTDAIEFPTVILCNYNRVNKSRLVEVDITETNMWFYVEELDLEELTNETLSKIGELSLVDNLLAVVFESYWNEYPIMPGLISGENDTNIILMTLGRALYQAYMDDHPEYEDQIDLLDALSFTCRSVYVCSFNGMYFDCCTGSIKVFTLYGSCFTITPPTFTSVPKQTSPGIANGLQLSISTHIENSITNVVNNWIEVGYTMYVTYGHIEARQTSIPIPIGFRSQVELTKTVETTTEKGFGIFPKPCIDYTTTDLLKYPYSVDSCIEECYMVEIIQKCDCVPAEVNIHGLYRSCQPDDLFLCVNPRIKSVWRNIQPDPGFNKTLEEYIICRDKCIKPCARKTLGLTSSLASGPSKTVMPQYTAFARKLSFPESNEIADSFIMVDVYFKDLIFTEIENYPRITTEQLLGNIGGVLGLWIGASLFTIVELTESFVRAAFWSKKKSTSEETKSSMFSSDVGNNHRSPGIHSNGNSKEEQIGND